MAAVEYDAIIVRYNEVGLKGKNRGNFETRLVENIRDCLKQNKIGFKKILRKRGRIVIYADENCAHLEDVFGVASFSRCLITNPDMESIKEQASKLILGMSSNTKFRISAVRADKRVEMNSQKIMEEIGAYVIEKTNAKVSLKEFDVDIGIEIVDGEAYLYNEKVEGLGGLPLGTGGKTLVLNDNKEALVSAWLMMKRGCEVILLGKQNKETSGLEKFSYGSKIKYIENSSLLEIGKRLKVFSIVLSQNIEQIKKIKTDMLVLRPNIGYEEDEINEILSKITG